MKQRNIILVTVLCLTLLSSCLEELMFIRGNGISVTEERRTGTFSKIENSTSVDVVYKKADSTFVSIKGDENLLDYIVTETYDNKLEIKTRNCNTKLDFREKPLITVYSPGIEEAIISGSGAFIADEMSGETIIIKMSGSGDISVIRVIGSDLTLLLSGSGHINITECQSKTADLLLSGSGSISIKGQADNNSVKITGSGEVRSDDFLAQSASVIISGSGNAYINTEHSLTAIITGSGNIYLRGDPVVNKTITGSGRIIKY